MNLRSTLTALTLAGASLMAAIPASAQAYYRRGPVARPVQVAPQYGGRQSAVFVMQTRTQMNALGNELQAKVSRGMVAPQALNRFNAERSRIEMTLRRVERDGVITSREQGVISAQVSDLSRIDEQYRVSRRGGWRR